MLPHNPAPSKRLVVSYVGKLRAVRGSAVMTNRYKCACWGREHGSEFCHLQQDPQRSRKFAHNPAKDRIRERHGLLTKRLLATATTPLNMIGPEWAQKIPSASGKGSMRRGKPCCYRSKDSRTLGFRVALRLSLEGRLAVTAAKIVDGSPVFDFVCGRRGVHRFIAGCALCHASAPLSLRLVGPPVPPALGRWHRPAQ